MNGRSFVEANGTQVIITATDRISLERARKFLCTDLAAASRAGIDGAEAADRSGNAALAASFLLVAAEAQLVLGYPHRAMEAALRARDAAGRCDIGCLCANAEGLLGAAARQSGNIGAAFAHYRESLTYAYRCGARDTIAFALVRLGTLCAFSGEIARARALVRRARRLARRTRDRRLRLNLLYAQGRLHALAGRFTASIGDNQRAIAISEAAGDLPNTALAHTNIASVELRVGQYTDALAHAETALEICIRLGDERGRLLAQDFVAASLAGLGKYDDAIASDVECLVLARTCENRFGETVAWCTMAEIYLALEDIHRAAECTESSLAISRAICHRQGEADALCRLGRCYAWHGLFSRALLHYHAALGLARRIGDRFLETASMHGVGTVHAGLGNVAAAKDLFLSAIAMSESIGATELRAQALQSLGMLHRDTNNHSQAAECFADAYELALQVCNRGLARQMLCIMASSCTATDPARAAALNAAAEKMRQHMFGEQQTARISTSLARVERLARVREARALGLDESELTSLTPVFNAIGDRRSIGPPRPFDSGTAPEYVTGPTPPRPSAHRIATPPPRYRLICFGEMRLWVSGSEIGPRGWGRKRARDLFKLLLTHYRRPLAIDEIIESLWGDSGGRDTEMLVMNTVARLRRILEPTRSPHSASATLPGVNRTYMLDLGEDADIDVLRFKELVVLARQANGDERYELYRRAVALYSGDYLKEDYYSEWCASERELLKDAYLESLEFIALRQLATQSFTDAAETARLLLQHDDTSGTAYTVLLGALHNLGRTGELRRMCRQCELAFQRETGTLPPERLRVLIASLSL